MDFLRFIQPAMPDLEDIVVHADAQSWSQTDREGKAFIKVLWTGAESGGWAVLYKFLAGYRAPRHKHLGAIHTFIVSGRLQVRDRILGPGDYMYEPNGQIHDETTALDDVFYINIGTGPLLFFDDDGFQYYAGWEQMLTIQRRAEKAQEA